jgi:protein-disulfide isomerase
MQRLNRALAAIVFVLAGGLSSMFMVGAGLAQDSAPVQFDEEAMGQFVENYLIEHPEIIERALSALDDKKRLAATERTRAVIDQLHDEIYNDPDQVVLGNPDGDVTLVEMFDYNCGYCRSALPDMAALLDEDKNLKIILKEFPILSQSSVDAARIAIAAHRAGIDYWAFHLALFSGRGQVTADAALKAAEAQGLSRISLQLDAAAQVVTEIIQRSYTIAQAIGTTGTPTYIIGDEIIPGAIGIEALKARIANIRACGSTVCKG